MAVIVHNIARQPLADLERWRAIPPAIIADVSKGQCQIDPAIRPLNPPGRQPRLFGRAVTVDCAPPDFGAVLYAMDVVGAGEVLVIAAGGNAGIAMIGEILGGQLHRRGAAGIVCDGAIRDVGELSAMTGLSVFARHITPRGPSSYANGAVNGIITCGGRNIHPGDLVIGDDDGLVSLSPTDMAQHITAAEAKVALEAEWQKSLTDGRTVAETFGLKPVG